jgi:Outer membrane protein beta-barrel domain
MVNPCPGDNVSLDYLVRSDSEERVFKEKRQFMIWLADRLLGEEPFVHGIRLSWSYSSLFRRSLEELYTDINDGKTEKNWDMERGFLMGIRSGWFLKWKISEHLRIQPEIFYKVKSNSRSWQNIPVLDTGIYDIINELKLSNSMQYLKIPLVLRYKHKQSNSLYSHLALGVAVNINLHGLAKWSYTEDGNGYEQAKHTCGRIDLDNLNEVSHSLIAGFGIDHSRFILDIYYEYGITEIEEPYFADYLMVDGSRLSRFVKESFDYKQYSLSITAGYKFNGKK